MPHCYKVPEVLDQPHFIHSAQERVYGYLRQFIGNIKMGEVRNFLRFVTAGSVLANSTINVTFNALGGLAHVTTAWNCLLSISPMLTSHRNSKLFCLIPSTLVYGYSIVNCCNICTLQLIIIILCTVVYFSVLNFATLLLHCTLPSFACAKALRCAGKFKVKFAVEVC